MELLTFSPELDKRGYFNYSIKGSAEGQRSD